MLGLLDMFLQEEELLSHGWIPLEDLGFRFHVFLGSEEAVQGKISWLFWYVLPIVPDQHACEYILIFFKKIVFRFLDTVSNR
jgi:hypothetical protein